MMLIPYLRSSNYNLWHFCNMKYFIQTNAGYQEPGNKKANYGTCAHKIMEIVANCTKAIKQKEKHVDDEIMGRISTKLTDASIEKIIRACFNYYSELFSYHEWEENNFKDIRKWSWKLLDSEFDPRKLDIVDTETLFDIEIVEPWSMYDIGNGPEFMRLKGSIDLTHRVNEDTICLFDLKTGRRLNWNTGEVKTQESFAKDPQLLIYLWAASKIYPDNKHFMSTIYYVNDGGAFTTCFDKSHIDLAYRLIQEKVEEIKQSKRPYKNVTWKCRKLCKFSKPPNEQDQKNGLPIIQEFRGGKFSNRGDSMSVCDFFDLQFNRGGIKLAMTYKNKEFDIARYKAPGTAD